MLISFLHFQGLSSLNFFDLFFNPCLFCIKVLVFQSFKFIKQFASPFAFNFFLIFYISNLLFQYSLLTFEAIRFQFEYSTKHANRMYNIVLVSFANIIDPLIVEESKSFAICYSCNFIEMLKGITFRVTNTEAMETFHVSLQVKVLLVIEIFLYLFIVTMAVSQEENKMVSSGNNFDLVNGNLKCFVEVCPPRSLICITPLCWLHKWLCDWDIRLKQFCSSTKLND